MFDLDDFFNDNNIYLQASDMAQVVCNDCRGCTNCCRELSAAITLDAWDMKMLTEGLEKSFDELLEEGSIALAVSDGVLLPIFGNKKDRAECVFLGDDGRCTIHSYRAGICRMYPLARRWKADGNFAYYLQKGECPNRTGEEMTVSEWLGYDDIYAYEQAIRAYRLRLNEYRRACAAAKDGSELEMIRRKFLNDNFRHAVS